MSFRVYALRTGAIVMRHIADGKGALAGAELIAEGDPLNLPRRVYMLARRGKAGAWFVPGAISADDTDFAKACLRFRTSLDRLAEAEADSRSRLTGSPSEPGADRAGPGGLQ